MANELFRLRESISNKPQLMLPSMFSEAFEYLSDRNSGLIEKQAYSENDDEFRSYTLNDDFGVAVFDLHGAMTYRETFMQAWCGGVSYAKLTKDFEHLVLDKGVKTVVFMADSGGGEAYKMMPTANYLRQLADDNGVRIITGVDGMAASACYGITCISDDIILLEGSEVGSIGVVVQLINNDKALKKEGYERSFVYAGNSKIPYTEDGEFSESFLGDIQASVESMYEDFTSHVAKHRNLSVDLVKNTEAKMFEGLDALNLGLVDAVMNDQEFWTYVADVVQENETLEKGGNMPLSRMLGRKDTSAAVEAEVVQELSATEVETLNAAITEKDQMLAETQEKLVELQGQMTAQATALEEATALLATMQGEALQAKSDGRKAQLSAVLPVDQVEAMQASLEGLADEQFGVVLAGLETAHKSKLASEDFQEVGSNGATVVVEEGSAATEDATDKMIAEKYSA